MSRVGKKIIDIPQGVSVTTIDGRVVIKGPKGEVSRPLSSEMSLKEEGGKLEIVPIANTKKTPALWGLTRAIIAHSVEGVTKGFEKKLELEGIGYRVNLEGKDLVFALGFSHPVKFKAPVGIDFKVEKNLITVSGFDKELVGGVAAKIRELKKPEPYKGKGIHYVGEVIRRKAGKKATTGTA
jgi:large subunit ribosomal protein L6